MPRSQVPRMTCADSDLVSLSWEIVTRRCFFPVVSTAAASPFRVSLCARATAATVAALQSSEPYLMDYFTLDLGPELVAAGFRSPEVRSNSPRHRTCVAFVDK